MRRQLTTTLVTIVGVAAVSASLQAQWPQWRGPNRDGVVPKASVPAAWPAKATVKWKQVIGEGYSSPVVANGRVYVHSRKDPEEIVTAFDATTGALKWRKDWSKEIDMSKLFTGTAMSPILDGGLLIVHVGDDRGGAF